MFEVNVLPIVPLPVIEKELKQLFYPKNQKAMNKNRNIFDWKRVLVV